MIYVYTIIFFLTAVGCTLKAVDSATPSVPTPTTVQERVEAKLDWDSKPGALAWSKELRKQIRFSLPDLMKAKDWKLYCPKFSSISDEQRIEAIATMAVGIAYRESGYKPGDAMKESDGAISEGLFQLTYGDRYCPKKKSEGSLIDPLVNIQCAVRLMAYYVSENGTVAEGGYTKYGAPAPKGVARYWSVMRVPDSKSKHYLAEIKGKTNALSFCK